MPARNAAPTGRSDWKDPGRSIARNASSGTVSQTTCDRRPAARPAQNAATASARVRRAVSVIACTATAAASPLLSLSGRAAVNQNNGVAIVSAVAATSHRAEPSLSSSWRNSHAIASTPSPALITLTSASAVAARGTTACTAFASTMNSG